MSLQGAEYIRFAHSIGIRYLMGGVWTNLLEMGTMKNQDDIKKLGIAALLHDVRQYPLTHMIEESMREFDEEAEYEESPLKLLTRAILSDGPIGHWPRPRGDSHHHRGTHGEPLFKQLMHSDLDVDRMDCLIRHSCFTEPKHEICDCDQLIRWMTVNDDGILHIVEDGEAA